MKQGTDLNGGLKECCRCRKTYDLSMFRADPQKKDGRYSSCRVCTAKNGWGALVRVIRRVPCEGCGKHFTPRHNKGKFIRHCSRDCAREHRVWRGENNGSWRGSDIGYGTAHERVRTELGPANERACVDCGGEAAQWSVNRNATTLRFENGMPYSSDPNDYEARCTSCHKLYDLAALSA